jgi:hypothetical protein
VVSGHKFKNSRRFSGPQPAYVSDGEGNERFEDPSGDEDLAGLGGNSNAVAGPSGHQYDDEQDQGEFWWVFTLFENDIHLFHDSRFTLHGSASPIHATGHSFLLKYQAEFLRTIYTLSFNKITTVFNLSASELTGWTFNLSAS